MEQGRASARRNLAAEARQVLAAEGWLARCSPAFREAVLDAAIFRLAPGAATLFHAHDRSGGLFGIARGTIEVSLHLDHPDTPIMDLAHAGFWAGFRPLLGRPRSLTVVARTELLWALVPLHSIRSLLEREPGWWRHIAELSDDNTEIALGIASDLTRQDSRSRAIATLLRMAGCRYRDPPDVAVLELRISQVELAALAVMSRNTLNTIMGELIARRLVTIGYRSIRLVDPAGLRALLESDRSLSRA